MELDHLRIQSLIDERNAFIRQVEQLQVELAKVTVELKNTEILLGKALIHAHELEAENKRLGEERDEAREQRDFWSKRTGELEATNKIAVGQLVMLQHGKVLSKLDDKKGK